jgi:circadian clock protein KaiB
MTTAPAPGAGPPLDPDQDPDQHPDQQEQFDLFLFISGASASSTRAVADVRAFCDLHLRGRHQLRIVDVYRDPDEATAHGVLATPTLVKDRPLPRRVLVGDLSDPDRVLLSLGTDPAAGSQPGSAVGRAPDGT